MILENCFQVVDNVTIYPTEYFDPKDCWTGILNITENTFSIHHADATWKDEKLGKRRRFSFYKYKECIYKIKHFPNIVTMKMLGDGYDRLKKRIKGD